MRFIAFITSLLLLGNLAFSQSNKCADCIPWNENRKLEWSDFKGKPKKASPNEALTDSGMSIELKCDGTSAEAVIKCFFSPSKSWTKSTDSDYLLAHEQLHFDITELFVRKLRQKLDKHKGDCEALSKNIDAYYNSNYREFVAYQDRYDSESKHSLNKEKQAYWEAKIQRELDELKAYSSSLASN
jgi:hypothetical protein